MLEHKAHEVVSNLDLSKALSMDIPPEQIAANALQEAQSELQVSMKAC